MKHITAAAAKKNFSDWLDAVIEGGESVSIATDKGAAILISQDEWSGLQETLYLLSIPGMTESIRIARDAPESERLEDVGWAIS